jgi:tRNA pseudouridine32 synthase/23S rRNA pseudouridine746 synthase
MLLHPLSDFLLSQSVNDDSRVNYYYQGRCDRTGELLKLPRSALAEAIAKSLMQELAADGDRFSREGKMYGILLVELPSGERRVLKAFSGLLNGCSEVEGWVSPIPGRQAVTFEENQTLTQLETIKQKLLTLKQLPQRQQYETLSGEFARQLQIMSDRHRTRKEKRQEKRQQYAQTFNTEKLEKLDEESRQDGIEKRKFKQQRDRVLQPLISAIAQADNQIRALKQRRKALSRQLQAQMHAVYFLTNFAGKSRSLEQLVIGGLPTGTGDCCAPKLLHYAATHHLKPLAMAEFWWGNSTGDKIAGEFYGACLERCQPLMGFLLSGLKAHTASFLEDENEISILYQDRCLVAANKPAGLLSVPGRYRETQDSVISRLRYLLPDGENLIAVHRLDKETSGVLLLARDRDTHRHLSQQFQQRNVRKIYEAILAGNLKSDRGAIALPLWGDPENRPYQKVNWQHGKVSETQYQVLTREKETTRVEFMPLTGRTHQLRVHSADVRGLGMPILGDTLYGCNAGASRLYLHAKKLTFEHPKLKKLICISAKTPF